MTGVQTCALPIYSAQKAKELVDGAANAVAPGIVDEKNKEAQDAKDRAEAERLAKERENFDYGSCPPTAAACVDLTKQRTWLQKNGKAFGPARDMSSLPYIKSASLEY